MKHLILFFFAVLMVIGCDFSIYAANPTESVIIHYSGTVVIPPCQIDQTNMSVDFGNVSPSALASTGQTTDWKDFTINLTQCSGVNVITMTMSGTPAADAKYYATTGEAKNVNVEISDTDGHDLSNGKYVSYYDSSVSELSLSLRARLRNDGNGPATAGTLSSVITATFSYK